MLISARRAAPLLALLVLALPAPGGAQAAASPDLRREAARALREARAAQAAFERLRVRHLPWTSERGGGECDERIGRFCLWHGDDAEVEWKPPPEPEPVRTGRQELIAKLAEAAARAPGDEWVAGQRVRYLVEAGRHAEVPAAADACGGSGWWCTALRAYARHNAREHAEADSLYAAALVQMPERERREWTDLSVLLGPDGGSTYRRSAGEERARTEARFWWLADPFWMDPGNPRRTEHFSRWVVDRLQERAKSPEGISWGDDLREILLRYGAPIGWERIRPSHPMMVQHGVSVITHYGPSRLSAPPPFSSLRDPLSLKPEDWPADDRRARVDYEEDFGRLDHQVAFFRRGDSARVVAAYALDPDSVAADAAVEAGVVLMDAPDAEPRLERRMGTGPRGVLTLDAPPGPTLLSLEARAGPDSLPRVGRARYAVRAPAAAEGVSLSDVLLLGDPDPLPATLDEAVPRARGSTRVRPGERVGLFWEVYGLPAQADTVAFSLQVTREAGGWMRRMAEQVGVLGAAPPVRVRWEEETAGEPVLARSLVLALPGLAPGRYTLELAVAPREGTPVTVSRELRVER